MAIRSPLQCEVGPGLSDKLWRAPVGAEIADLERRLLSPMLRRLHGDTVLWVGDHLGSASDLTRCMVRTQLHLVGSSEMSGGGLPALVADLQALPFASNSMDGVVLHHALERVDDPRVALREVARVLAPGGRALICGFNPLSLMGLRRLYARFFDDAMSDRRLVNPIRLFDWLTLLGLELQSKPLYCGYLLPSIRGRHEWLQALRGKTNPVAATEEKPARTPRPSRLPFGGLLIVDVVKQASAHRLHWTDQKRERNLAPVAYPRVAGWQRTKR